ncbi:hypothetical protein T05_5672 [Trichinella murrelli]|uniref:Uncharacterized protein n=1 Tax=Trichinella murrelli TaxID=144512 RepID=A0A0V0U1M1_9BILA|nr:hypothetical protein T05_5672 [Trichinella murrelli]
MKHEKVIKKAQANEAKVNRNKSTGKRSAVTLPPSSSRLHIGRPGEHIRKLNPFRTNDPVKLAINSTVTVAYPHLVVAQEADASASDFIRLAG